MINLNTKIESYNFSNQLIEVNNLLTNGVTAGLNCWGAPAIEVAGYRGSLPIESIAERILKAGEERCQADNLSLPERMAAIDLIEKVKIIYIQT
ncbi:MAG: hypothetical protein H0U49_03350, partial [Parachlamydiaceae bacterium]|nr:hypothetical protein [Parachlamydiaceae bacterium]